MLQKSINFFSRKIFFRTWAKPIVHISYYSIKNTIIQSKCPIWNDSIKSSLGATVDIYNSRCIDHIQTIITVLSRMFTTKLLYIFYSELCKNAKYFKNTKQYYAYTSHCTLCTGSTQLVFLKCYCTTMTYTRKRGNRAAHKHRRTN